MAAILWAEERLMSQHVAIIGAGIVGAASAMELLRDGHRVTIIEPGDPGGEQAASYGNGTLLNPSSVIPPSTPGIWKKVPGYLTDPLGPLSIRWTYLPKLFPWLRRFAAAGSTPEKLSAIARALQPLLAEAPERHRAPGSMTTPRRPSWHSLWPPSQPPPAGPLGRDSLDRCCRP